MTIEICFRPPAHLHTLQEASLGLRANRSNSTWWDRLARQTIAETDAEIEKFVAARFDDYYTDAIDLRTIGENLVLVKGGISRTFARQGDAAGLIEFVHLSGSDHMSTWTWRIGDPPLADWWTADRLRAELCDIVHNRRVDEFVERFDYPPDEDTARLRGLSPEAFVALLHRAFNARDAAIAAARAGEWQQVERLLEAVRWPPTEFVPDGYAIWSSAIWRVKELTNE